jgi:hypothetical protein
VHEENVDFVKLRLGAEAGPAKVGSIGAFVWLAFAAPDRKAADDVVAELLQQTVMRDLGDGLEEERPLSVVMQGELDAALLKLEEAKVKRADKAKNFKLQSAITMGAAVSQLGGEAQQSLALAVAQNIKFVPDRKRRRDIHH